MAAASRFSFSLEGDGIRAGTSAGPARSNCEVIRLDDGYGARGNHYDDDVDEVEEEEIFGEFDDDDDDECELSFVSNGGDNSEDDRFDRIVGALEDIMMDDEFQDKQNSFIHQNCGVFENTEENKLIYMELFNQYTEQIETYIERRLAAAVPGFNMQEFLDMLASREEEINGEIFEMLLSFGDFNTFKELMLAHKHDMSGDAIRFDISVTKLEIADMSMEECSIEGLDGLNLGIKGSRIA